MHISLDREQVGVNAFLSLYVFMRSGLRLCRPRNDPRCHQAASWKMMPSV